MPCMTENEGDAGRVTKSCVRNASNAADAEILSAVFWSLTGLTALCVAFCPTKAGVKRQGVARFRAPNAPNTAKQMAATQTIEGPAGVSKI